MTSFIIALISLILGYLLYGKFAEKAFGINAERKTPCYTREDGIDYMPMPTWKVFLIQFLNIAGTGPIFGAIMGILFGPAAYLWIVFGCIFAGAVHDYMVGMICIRKDGLSLPEIVGDEMGFSMRQFMRVLSIVLLVLVGTVFVTTSAALLDTLVPFISDTQFDWIGIIFLYFILATLLPIDKLIGKVYPVLFEQEKDGRYAGHAPNYMKIYTKGENLHNELRNIRILKLHQDGLLGELV